MDFAKIEYGRDILIVNEAKFSSHWAGGRLSGSPRVEIFTFLTLFGFVGNYLSG
jgi:hypothetical protein